MIVRMFTEAMLWTSVPLFGWLGYWEGQLSISNTDRRLVQILLLLGMFGWIWFWNSRVEDVHLSQMKNLKSKPSFDDDRLEIINIMTIDTADGRFQLPIQQAAEIEKRINVSINH